METNQKQGGGDGVNLQTNKEETLYANEFKGCKIFSSSSINPTELCNWDKLYDEVITTSNLESSIKNRI